MDNAFQFPLLVYLSLLPLVALAMAGILAAAAAGDVGAGSVLRATYPDLSWKSSQNTFSFGFTKSADNPSLYHGGLSHIASATLIWTAGGNSPAAVDSRASFHFSTDGNLRLFSGSGVVVWESGTGNRGVSVASIDESGNFVLRNSTAVVWDTFNHPTDVLIQNQILTLGQTLRSGLYSFSFSKSPSLLWNDTIQYWNLLYTDSNTLVSPVLVLGSDGILKLFKNSSTVDLLRSIYGSDYNDSSVSFRFLRLDSDGNLRAYSVSNGGAAISIQWSAIENQCDVFGYCGNMGLCTYDGSQNPICICPSEDFVQADLNDPRKGCERKQQLSDCPENSMIQLENTVLLTYPPQLQDPNRHFYCPMSACSLYCLRNAACLGSTMPADGSGACFSKFSEFISLYRAPTVPSTSFMKVCGSGTPTNTGCRSSNSSEEKRLSLGNDAKVIIVVVTISSLIVIETFLWWLLCKKNREYFTGIPSGSTLLEYASGAPVRFSYKELYRWTNGFKEKLGEGGVFGPVYKGELENRTSVVVKLLQGIEQTERQFQIEVAGISSIHHLNLIRLIGFCIEGRHRLLVYEFVKNGSLDRFLFSENARKLCWDARFKIALDAAKGMTYLHEECRNCIIHCDLKPENILLDESYNAKVSDFGIAKLINPQDRRLRALLPSRKMKGYLAPEWFVNVPVTTKSDVYSYGILLLEIISGQRISDETERSRFLSWAFGELEKGDIERIVDKRIGFANQAVEERLVRAIQVSFWCIQEQPSLRPSMGKVVQMLQGVLAVDTPPAPIAMQSKE